MLAVATDRSEDAGPVETGPTRTCAGCREAGDAAGLLRLRYVPDADPALVWDPKGKLGGRGVWLHADRACLRKAVRGGFARSLRRPMRVGEQRLAELLVAQLLRRVEGLLSSCLRRREAEVGTDAVQQWFSRLPSGGAGGVLVVAKDAAGHRDALVRRAEALGVPCVEAQDKAWLGSLAGRATVGVLGVSNTQIADELRVTIGWISRLSEDG